MACFPQEGDTLPQVTTAVYQLLKRGAAGDSGVKSSWCGLQRVLCSRVHLPDLDRVLGSSLARIAGELLFFNVF